MKHFLIITEDFPPAPGGISQWAYGVANELKKKGNRVTILSRKNILNQFLISSLEFDFIKFPTWQWKNLKLMYIYPVVFYSIVIQNPDFVIATTWDLGKIASFFCSSNKQKLITVYHGLEVTKKMTKQRLVNLTKTIKKSDLNIAVSKFTKEQLVSISKADEERISVINNGVDLEKFKPLLPNKDLIEKYGLQNKRVVLTLSRVIERKGHDIVIQALSKVVKKYNNVIYLIAGAYHTDFYNKLVDLVNKLNLGQKVIFTGKLSPEEISEIYNLCEFYIMVSKGNSRNGDSEGFGITYLEANACKKAVIGSKTDGIIDAVEDGVNGLLVAPNNILETEQAIVQLLENKDLANKLGENGLQRIKMNFTWEKITESILLKFN